MVFSPVAFQLDQPVQPPNPECDAEGAIRKSTVGTLQKIFSDSLRRLFHPNDVSWFSMLRFFVYLFSFLFYFWGVLCLVNMALDAYSCLICNLPRIRNKVNITRLACFLSRSFELSIWWVAIWIMIISLWTSRCEACD